MAVEMLLYTCHPGGMPPLKPYTWQSYISAGATRKRRMRGLGVALDVLPFPMRGLGAKNAASVINVFMDNDC